MRPCTDFLHNGVRPLDTLRTEGKLSKWNDDRGFGFITPTQGGSDIFVHVSAFPKNGHRPTIGERLTFEIENDRDGKKRASHVFCPDQPAVRVSRPPAPRRRSFLGRVIPLALFAGLAFYGYNHYDHRSVSQAVIASPPSKQATPSNFRCDGRTHCSQMTSCAEATFFLRNCPNVKMDGNNDGIPCEQQWCN
jgi:cold shock CspA family protein